MLVYNSGSRRPRCSPLTYTLSLIFVLFLHCLPVISLLSPLNVGGSGRGGVPPKITRHRNLKCFYNSQDWCACVSEMADGCGERGYDFDMWANARQMAHFPAINTNICSKFSSAPLLIAVSALGTFRPSCLVSRSVLLLLSALGSSVSVHGPCDLSRGD